MTKLSPSQVDKRLASLSGWRRKGRFITKSYTFDTFMDGIMFVNHIAAIAERLEHHPDVHIRWTTIRLAIQTHDEGGITDYDIELAEEIDRGTQGVGRSKRRFTKADRTASSRSQASLSSLG